MNRRDFAATAVACALTPSLARPVLAQERRFAPEPGGWRTFEIVTRVELQNTGGPSQAWIPVPSVDTEWQRSLASHWAGNATSTRQIREAAYGAGMIHASWPASERAPVLEVVSRFQSKDRAHDWNRPAATVARPSDLATFLAATELMPTDGIVRETARRVTAGKATDVEKVRALYRWVVENTYREPKVRCCGTGNIKTMLETGNLGGKCADINALFVGMARSVGVPARDVYGIRVVKSAFGYRELGAGSSDITRAQHCRAEVWLAGRGWVAMDPADVGKVMRLETADWIKDRSHPVVAPVERALFGGWEGNWLAYNVAHDVVLPGSALPRVGFFMYPQAETRGARCDSLDPDTFRYRITAREVAA